MTRRRWSVTLALGLAIALVVVAIPVALIKPFDAQTAGGVALAFTLRRWSPIVTAGAALLVVVSTWRLWAGARWPGRAGSVLASGAVLATAWFARQDYFEWMFAPLPTPGFVRAAQASFVPPEGMVLAVNLKGDAAAYPVQQLAYHHLVEDAVGGVPIVATY